MRIDVISLFPEMFEAVTAFGVTGRAADKGLLDVRAWNPRDYTTDKHRTVDDRPYGGGPGMVMKVEPLTEAVHDARASAGKRYRTICLSPQGRPLTQRRAEELAREPGLVLIAGRYEGIDERFIDAEVDEEVSIGDYVLSGGELPAMVLIDAITRLLPGALGDADSAEEDSFVQGWLDCPHYTRPEEIDGRRVPQVLLDGNHAEIRRWRLQQSLGRTWQRRPDLLDAVELDDEQAELLKQFIRERGRQDSDSQ
ncbi:MAG: tRNA (guanosine(37)-N1)-methyltransferase TrmD [Gammaproteobacteria bacterium]|nr:tRNA (guanosine(37)-N1)-methyltransferase TrmD [Gammaproteobacteria bacterium]